MEKNGHGKMLTKRARNSKTATAGYSLNMKKKRMLVRKRQFEINQHP